MPTVDLRRRPWLPAQESDLADDDAAPARDRYMQDLDDAVGESVRWFPTTTMSAFFEGSNEVAEPAFRLASLIRHERTGSKPRRGTRLAAEPLRPPGWPRVAGTPVHRPLSTPPREGGSDGRPRRQEDDQEGTCEGARQEGSGQEGGRQEAATKKAPAKKAVGQAPAKKAPARKKATSRGSGQEGPVTKPATKATAAIVQEGGPRKKALTKSPFDPKFLESSESTLRGAGDPGGAGRG